MSTNLVRVQHKGAVTIPTRLRTQAGIAEGDLVEMRFHQGKIVLVPKVVIDRSQFPTADDEYTPSQRRLIDTRLAKSDADIRHERVHGPFATAKEMAVSIERRIKKRRTAKLKRDAVSSTR